MSNAPLVQPLGVLLRTGSLSDVTHPCRRSWIDRPRLSKIKRNYAVIEFSGTASQVARTFHTEIHRYIVNGTENWANASDPQIPEALLPVVSGVVSLHNFPRSSLHRVAGVFSRSNSTGLAELSSASTEFTFPGKCNPAGFCHPIGPYDFAVIYNVAPLWNATPAIDGTGQSIAIVGETNINLQDVRDFRSLFGLPASDPQVILDGPDPGLVPGDETEADLDVEWSGAVARGAIIKLVVSASTNTTAGIDLSALYIIENRVAPVMSESYGECELFLGTAGNQFYSTLWEQAAAEGISVVTSSGDEGSARCDSQANPPNALIASHGLAVSGIASTPFNVAVGGTDFEDFYNDSAYWNTTNDAHQASAKGYIPETVWNQNCTNALFGTLPGLSNDPETNCNSSQLRQWLETVGGGGGRSNCISSNASSTSTCSGGYTKPTWQTGPSVPSDGVRDLPDISLFASANFVGSSYIVCEADHLPTGSSSCNLNSPYTNFLGVGGTSGAAPAFAGIIALVNQFTQSTGQGNPNYVLYKLAALPSQQGLNCNASTEPAFSCIFQDVTAGANTVPCLQGTPNCNVNHPPDVAGVISGFNAGSGYDLATGLGTVNAYNLVQNWNSVTFVPSTTTLLLSPTNITHGDTVAVSVKVASGSSGTGTPTGDVSLLAPGANPIAVQAFTLDASGSVSPTNNFTNLLPGGTHNIIAHYAGDATFGASDSLPVTVTVSPENSITTLTPLTTAFTGLPTHFSATSYGTAVYLRSDISTARAGGVTDSPPTGTVTLTDTYNGTTANIGSLTLNSLGYALTPQPSYVFGGGAHTITASYSGDNNYQPSQTSATFTINRGGLNFDAIAAPGFTVPVGTSVTLTIKMVSGNDSRGNPPTGTMTFLSGSMLVAPPVPVIGSVEPQTNVVGATATLTSSQLPVGRGIIAQYSGDANYLPGQITTVVDVVIPTMTTVTSTSSSTAQGTPVTFTATVAPTQAAGPAITGEVTYTVTVTGSSGTLTHNTAFTFVVQ